MEGSGWKTAALVLGLVVVLQLARGFLFGGGG